MIGERYWSIGIVLRYSAPRRHHAGAWRGHVGFHDSGFANDSAADGRVSTEGALLTRYAVEAEPHEIALAAVIDALVHDAAHLGIEWVNKHLYYLGDGEDPAWPPPPNWRELLHVQAKRIGWESAYGSHVAAPES